MNGGPGVFELSFNENNGIAAPVAAASTFTVPVELVPYAEACLPGDNEVQKLYHKLIPKIDDEMACCCDRLTAMKTRGDGDCLLHAVMQSLCGREDTEKIFRQLLVPTMTSSRISAELKSLWLASESTEDEAMGFPNAREDFQLVKGYEQCVEEATEAGCFLGPLHVACLANILCRPIVVYADEYVRDSRGEPFSGQSMRGIYLPYLRDPEICHRRCVALLHSAAAMGVAGHFTALIGTALHAESITERKSVDIGIFQNSRAGSGKSSRLGERKIAEGSLIPLIDIDGRVLPLRYCSTSKHGVGSDTQKSELIRRYIDVASLPRAVHTMERGSGELDSANDFLLYAIQNNIRISSRIPSVSVVSRGSTYAMPEASARLEDFFSRVENHISNLEEQLKAQLLQLNEAKKLVHRMGSSQSSRAREVDLSCSCNRNAPKTTEISFDSFSRKPDSSPEKNYYSPGDLYSKHVETEESDYITSRLSSGTRQGAEELVPSPARETYGGRSDIIARERFVKSSASLSRYEPAQSRGNVTTGLVSSAAEQRQAETARMMNSPSRPACRTSLYGYDSPTASSLRRGSSDRVSSQTRAQSAARARPPAAASSIGPGPFTRSTFDDRYRRLKRQEWI